jgi:pyroglutamyl-peptidase
MKKILISGFSSFDGDAINPSEFLIQFLNQKSFSSIELCTVVLPVTFKDAYLELKNQIDVFNPDLILLCGVAKNRSKISLEKVAINWIDSRIPDNNGLLINGEKINQAGPDGLFTQLNLNQLIAKLADKNCEISYSAGTYVCNYIYYQTLLNHKIPSVFVHVPGTSEMINDYTAMKNDDLFQFISNFIETCF